MTAAIAFLTANPWRSLAIGLGILLALGFIRLEFAKATAERMEARWQSCQVNVTNLTTALEAQNRAVIALKEKADKEAAEAKERAMRAKEEAEKRRQRELADGRTGPERMNEFFGGVF